MEKNNEVNIFTDWTLLRGNDIAESLLIKLCPDDNESIDRTNLDDIVSFERSIHLQCNIQNTNDINLSSSSTCDINFQILPKYIINTLTIITHCQKAEIFKNIEKEYLDTVYGDFLDDFDGMQVYRHDIEITKSKSETCNSLTLKLIPKTHKIWIYGMQIILQKNSKQFNAIGSTSINLDNVQNILSNFNQKLSPNAERCKSFIQFMNTNDGGSKISPNKILGGSNFGINQNNLMTMFNLSNSTNPPNIENLMSIFNSNMDPKLIFNGNNNYDDGIKLNQQISRETIEQLKEYFDKKMLESENKILQRIEEMDTKQNEKLDKILDILKNSTTLLG